MGGLPQRVMRGCLFVNKVDSLKFKKMKVRNYEEEKKRYNMERELYLAVKRDHLPIMDVMQKFGLSRTSIYRIIGNFEAKNPQDVAFMKKQVQGVLPADYVKLQEELSELKKKLAEERLRADFYEEMVAYGKEVYGIDLKKAGTK